jgi:disulfide bond formation protein DsbB
MTTEKNFNLLYGAWLIAIVSIIGSMFFSQIMDLPPCSLCWYQRIFIFPLGITLAAGFVQKDSKAFWYSFPLALIGWIISLYHNLLYYKVIPKPIVPCSSGVSCTEKQLEILGFISIPLMALASLTLILIFLILFYKNQRKAL